MADNWYLVLELEFDPPEENEAVIEQRIDEKGRFWSTHFNDFKNGPTYRTLHQNLKQIKKDMIGPENRRKEMAAEAVAQVYGPLDKLLKTIGRKGNITADEGEKIAKKQKLSLDAVKKRTQKLGIQWVDTDYQAVYEKYYKTKPANAATFDGMDQLLAAFGVKDLYGFLYEGTEMKNANKLPCETLLQRSKEKKKTEFYKTDSKSGTGSKLCGQCDLAFKDENSKATYDRYLEYRKRKSILDNAKEIAEISGQLSPEQFDASAGQLTQILRDWNLAQDVLVAFCRVEGIPVSRSAEQSKKLIVCRCGFPNDVSDGRKVCSQCGLPLVISCPKCGTENEANVKVCKCGFRLENLDKAIALCEQAKVAIEGLDFAVADAHLADAERYWPKNDLVKAAKTLLEDTRKRVGVEVEKMRKAVEAKRFFEAQKQYDTIRKVFSGYKNPAMEEQIRTSIERAQELFRRAKASKVERDVLDLCTQAYELCTDLPGVREYMPAPSAVTGLSMTANPLRRENVISWDAGNDRSIRYLVVRSDAAWVQSPADGQTIYRGSGSSYVDRDIRPAAPYYYNVFAERGGIVSGGAKGKIEEVVNLFEVAHLNAVAGDASLQLTWDPLPSGAMAEISAGGKRLAEVTANSYLATGLRNEQSYTFHVSLSYPVRGQRRSTRGADVTGVPMRLPQAVSGLRVSQVKEGQFDAVWMQSEPGEVRLYQSEKKPPYSEGDALSVRELERLMSRVQQQPLSPETRAALRPGEQGAGFRYTGNDLIYLTAAVIKGETAIFGPVSRTGQGGAVKINSARVVNGKVALFLEPPPTATGFVVLYRADQFPSEIGDREASRKYVPLKQYQLDGAIMLDILEERKFYFSVFAEYRQGADRDYSVGSDYLFDNSPKLNITYSVSVNKRLLGGSQLILTFETDGKPFDLPDIEIMSNIGNAPMFKSSARPFYQIPAQKVHHILSLTIPLDRNTPRNTYIKAFFRDESAQAGSQLRLKLRSNLKIT